MALADAKRRREDAWGRLLRQLEMRQRYVDTTSAEMEERQRQEQLEQDEMRPGKYAHKGAALGGSIVPGWGHLIGAVAGKGYGSYEEAQREGGSTGQKVGTFVKEFVDPRTTFKALFSDPETQQIATGAASQGASAMARNQTAGKDEDVATMNELSGGGAYGSTVDGARMNYSSGNYEQAPSETTKFEFDSSLSVDEDPELAAMSAQRKKRGGSFT